MPAHFELDDILTLIKVARKKHEFVTEGTTGIWTWTWKKVKVLKKGDIEIFLLCCIEYFDICDTVNILSASVW